jgi:hypothetical protein
MAISTCRKYVSNFGPFFSQKVLWTVFSPPFSPVTKWQKFATKGKERKTKKKTIIPTIGFGKIEGLVSQPQNPKHLEKKIWNLFFLM